MSTCFVIQQFDSVYDQRFKDTFAPAIKKGGATPLRADEVLGTKPVIDKIIEKSNNQLSYLQKFQKTMRMFFSNWDLPYL